jgi:hypothetical protein
VAQRNGVAISFSAARATFFFVKHHLDARWRFKNFSSILQSRMSPGKSQVGNHGILCSDCLSFQNAFLPAGWI